MHANRREVLENGGSAGDIVAVIGLKNTYTGHTLCDPAAPIVFGEMRFPDTVISQSIETRSAIDGDKLAKALATLAREDPTFKRHADEETGEVLISGMGELHLEVLVHRLVREFKISLSVGRPRVAYRQTLTRPVTIEARHVKQSGGHGQFAVVEIEFEPIEGGEGAALEFEKRIVGGSVPTEYIPSVARGLRDAAKRGDRLRFPFVNVRASLVDGKAHDVDSSDMAFQIAGKLAFRLAVERVGTVLLEPKMKLEVVAPADHLRDVVGDLNKRRTEIRDVEIDGNSRVIRGFVPLAEMFDYTTTLRSLTQGRGTATMEPAEYAPVPVQVAEKVRAERLKFLESRQNRSR